MVSSELNAGRLDVGSQGPSNGGRDAVLFKDLREGFQPFRGTSDVVVFPHFIGGDQVDMAQHAFETGGQFSGALVGIVDAAHHRVLEGDPPVRGGDVVPAGLQQLFHAPAAIEWHDPVTDVVVRRVQGHRERELGSQLHELIDLRHDAAGGHRDVPGTDVGAVLPGDDVEETEKTCLLFYQKQNNLNKENFISNL